MHDRQALAMWLPDEQLVALANNIDQLYLKVNLFLVMIQKPGKIALLWPMITWVCRVIIAVQ